MSETLHLHFADLRWRLRGSLAQAPATTDLSPLTPTAEAALPGARRPGGEQAAPLAPDTAAEAATTRPPHPGGPEPPARVGLPASLRGRAPAQVVQGQCGPRAPGCWALGHGDARFLQPPPGLFLPLLLQLPLQDPLLLRGRGSLEARAPPSGLREQVPPRLPGPRGPRWAARPGIPGEVLQGGAGAARTRRGPPPPGSKGGRRCLGESLWG